MFYGWTWLVGLYIGAAIGSFLNVVIYRMPRGISLSNPKNSFCPNCKHQLGPLDLFPLFSWLFLGGKCRYCKVKVPSRYFFVELFNGLIWGGLWYQYMVLSWDPGRSIFYALAASTLVAIIYIDWELYIIPDQINAFLFFVGLAFNVFLYKTHSLMATTWGLPSSIVGALVGIGILWWIAMLGRLMFGKDAMGHGDIKMARGIGAVLFPGVATMSFGLAIVLGAIFGIIQIVAFSKAGMNLAEASGMKEESNGVTEQESEEELAPESIGSLIKCGIGYVLCVDIIGLFYKPLYISWFGEDPFTPIQEMDDYEVERTMIPFGPYLAIGAIVATIFQSQLLGGWDSYVKSVQGGPDPTQMEQQRR